MRSLRWRWRYCENSCEDGGDSGDAIITDAKTMYNYLKTKLTRKTKIQNVCNHSRREFFLVEVNRDRPDRAIKYSIKGTRKLHSVRGITLGVIQTRSLGCVCSYCITGEGVNVPVYHMWMHGTHRSSACKRMKAEEGEGEGQGFGGQGEAFGQGVLAEALSMQLDADEQEFRQGVLAEALPIQLDAEEQEFGQGEDEGAEV